MTSNFEHLMAEIQDANAMAYEELFSEVQPKVMSFLFQIGVRSNDLDDLTQETLFRVWDRCQQYDSRHGSVLAWIFRIARNQWLDLCRRRQRKSRGGGESRVGCSLDELEDESKPNNCAAYVALQNEIDSLPDDMRDICNATLSGESICSASARLGYSRTKASRKLKEAREIMETSTALRELTGFY